MLQLVNIDSDSSLEKISVVLVGFILSSQDVTSFMSVKGLIIIGIQEETQ